MARSLDLMGLGLPHILAGRVGDDPTPATATGQTVASAVQLGGLPSIWYVNASNSGSGVKLPPVGGDTGCLLGDDITIANLLGATIYVYASTNAAGSAMAMYGNATSATGSTGVSLISGAVAMFQAITVSTWLFSKASV